MTHERAIYILKNTAWLGTENDLAEVEKAIRILEDAEAPTIDAEPVRRGRWIVDEDGNVKCSVCGNGSSNDNFCEHCGAKMR